MYNFNQIEEKANQVLQDLNIVKYPIPVEMIARSLNLGIKIEDLGEGVSGVLVYKNGKGVIGINSLESEVRQRFTMAHEICHFLLHNKKEELLFIEKLHFRDENSSQGTHRQEIEANAFAANLLMPKEMVLKEVKKCNSRISEDEMVKLLAKKFNVSSIAMTFRLTRLNVIKDY